MWDPPPTVNLCRTFSVLIGRLLRYGLFLIVHSDMRLSVAPESHSTRAFCWFGNLQLQMLPLFNFNLTSSSFSTVGMWTMVGSTALTAFVFDCCFSMLLAACRAFTGSPGGFPPLDL